VQRAVHLRDAVGVGETMRRVLGKRWMGARFSNLFRQLTPLVLLGIALVALFGRSLPGFAWVAQRLGEDFLLGGCLFLLALYVLLLWGETTRLHGILTAVLKELVQFRNQRAAEVQGRPVSQKLEAVRLLLPALQSSDRGVASTSRKNLTLLVGQDLGAEPGPWQEWLAAQRAGGQTDRAAGGGGAPAADG
jgi:hypothetical protein